MEGTDKEMFVGGYNINSGLMFYARSFDVLYILPYRDRNM